MHVRFFSALTLLSLVCRSGAAYLRTAKDLSNNIVEHGPHYELPALGFPYDALARHFVGDQTMHLHHDKHHALYVKTLNDALASTEDVPSDVEVLVSHIRKQPKNVQDVVRNHGGGHMNHALFWKWLKPGGTSQVPKGPLHAKIVKDFESFEKFQSAFENAAATRFGSGWAWLVLEPGKQHLRVCSTANQDNPVMDVDVGDCRGSPVLGLDVWEHAYYLDYFNVRPKYVKAFWKVANWDEAEKRFAAAMEAKEVKEEQSAAKLAHLDLLTVLLIGSLCLP
jgi:Fe-Mn family superoxide dismutase